MNWYFNLVYGIFKGRIYLLFLFKESLKHRAKLKKETKVKWGQGLADSWIWAEMCFLGVPMETKICGLSLAISVRD